MNIESSIRWINAGWITAMVVVVVTGMVILLLLVDVESDNSGVLWNLIDVVFVSGIAYGIYRRIRTAAITALVYFFLVYVFLEIQELIMGSGSLAELGLGIILWLIFFQSARGIFMYRRLGGTGGRGLNNKTLPRR